MFDSKFINKYVNIHINGGKKCKLMQARLGSRAFRAEYFNIRARIEYFSSRSRVARELSNPVYIPPCDKSLA